MGVKQVSVELRRWLELSQFSDFEEKLANYGILNMEDLVCITEEEPEALTGPIGMKPLQARKFKDAILSPQGPDKVRGRSNFNQLLFYFSAFLLVTEFVT